MNKTISELINLHFDWLQNFAQSHRTRERWQLDYLRFYVPYDKIDLYWSPFNSENVRDNPNLVPTEFPMVYSMTDYKTSLWIYQIEWVAPVSVLRWSKVNIKKDWVVQELVEICIYWKALALYYAGHLSWLENFVIKYQWECTRADLCFDFNCDIPWKDSPWDIYTDLKRSAVYLDKDWENIDTVYYWKKHSPMFIRVYNKTEDLRKDRNIHSFIYPKWYMEKCWRVEFEFKWRYANVCTPLDWLTSQSRDFKIKPITQTKRNNYKTLVYSAISCIDIINYSDWEKILILKSVKDLIDNKLKNLYSNKL
jgi:hypothetical protein